MKNILVALDTDGDAVSLISHAEKLAEKFDAKIWLLHIATPEPDFVGYEVGPQYIRDFRAQELKEEHRHLQELAGKLRGRGLEADSLLIEGPTIEMILEEAKVLKVDLIVIGSHDHSFLYNALVGNTTSGLLKKSKIPLLTVPLG